MTIRKRSYSESSQATNDDENSSQVLVAPLSKTAVPIVIEVDDDCHHDAKAPLSKRLKTSAAATNCTSLNLLVKAMETIQRDDDDTDVVVDRVPSLCHEILKNQSADSSVATDAFPVESIRIPPIGRPLTKPSLPKGRPLLAPPRLPAHLKPGQILVRNYHNAPVAESA